MLQSTLNYLRSTANFFRFSKDEYICHEGQQGDSMYIVLQGLIGVYLTDPNGGQTEVSRIESGGFFGEMSIFDKMPRSASCIALEDSVCVSINKSNLSEFLLNCPDIVEQLLMSMSLRVRKMDEMLHNAQATISRQAEYAAFHLPPEFHNHQISEPKQSPQFLQTTREECFVDYAKDFDCVDHHKLWKILKEMGIPDHLTCFLRSGSNSWNWIFVCK